MPKATKTLYYSGDRAVVHPKGFRLVPGKNEIPKTQAADAMSVQGVTVRKPQTSKKTKPKKSAKTKRKG